MQTMRELPVAASAIKFFFAHLFREVRVQGADRRVGSRWAGVGQEGSQDFAAQRRREKVDAVEPALHNLWWGWGLQQWRFWKMLYSKTEKPPPYGVCAKRVVQKVEAAILNCCAESCGWNMLEWPSVHALAATLAIPAPRKANGCLSLASLCWGMATACTLGHSNRNSLKGSFHATMCDATLTGRRTTRWSSPRQLFPPEGGSQWTNTPTKRYMSTTTAARRPKKKTGVLKDRRSRTGKLALDVFTFIAYLGKPISGVWREEREICAVWESIPVTNNQADFAESTCQFTGSEQGQTFMMERSDQSANCFSSCCEWPGCCHSICHVCTLVLRLHVIAAVFGHVVIVKTAMETKIIWLVSQSYPLLATHHGQKVSHPNAGND